MEYFIILIVGIVLGLLITMLVRPEVWNTKSNYEQTAFESMLEEAIELMEQKQDSFLRTVNEKESHLRHILSDIETKIDVSSMPPKLGDVYALLHQGYSKTQIAEELGMGQGEVELLIRMHELRPKA